MKVHAFLLWWDRIIAMTVKELKQLVRDPVLLLIIVFGRFRHQPEPQERFGDGHGS
jgi:hypothetical protein